MIIQIVLIVKCVECSSEKFQWKCQSNIAVSKKIVFVMICNEIPRTYTGIFSDKLNAFSIILLYLSILFKLNSIFKLPLSPSAENRTMVSRRTFWGFVIAFCKHCCLCFIECHFKRLNILFKPISKDWK